MSEPYLCPRTRQLADPHVPVRRKTPRPPAPQTFNGPALWELLRENTPKRLPPDRATAGATVASFRPAGAHRAGEVAAFPTSPARPTITSATGLTRSQRGVRR